MSIRNFDFIDWYLWVLTLICAAYLGHLIREALCATSFAR
jgi:hypothetical protein